MGQVSGSCRRLLAAVQHQPSNADTRRLPCDKQSASSRRTRGTTARSARRHTLRATCSVAAASPPAAQFGLSSTVRQGTGCHQPEPPSCSQEPPYGSGRRSLTAAVTIRRPPPTPEGRMNWVSGGSDLSISSIQPSSCAVCTSLNAVRCGSEGARQACRLKLAARLRNHVPRSAITIACACAEA